jgi:hypothetical protein
VLAGLFGAFVRGKWKVPPQIHSVVEDAHDFDRVGCRCSVHQKVASATPVSCNVERMKTGNDLVSGPGACDVGTAGKLVNRLNERVPIDTRLSRAKILSRPFEDVRKVEFCGCAETDAPSLLRHDASIRLILK